jgi:outer membrane protein
MLEPFTLLLRVIRILRSRNVLDQMNRKVRSSAAIAMIFAFVLGTNAGFAETSGLTGLGEPAAPESMEHPNQLFPSNSGGNVTSSPASSDSYYLPTSGNPPPISPLLLHPRIEQTHISRAFTLKGAVEYSEKNYPKMLKGQSEVRAARRNVTVQKLNEYLPDSLIQYQELLASHNKLTSVFFGSPVFPAISGPATDATTMQPVFFAQGGASIDWAPLDFGLHKARINLAKVLAEQAKTQYASTALDVSLTTANAYLDAVIAIEQIRAAEQNVASFEQFRQVVHAQVAASLKPGADESLVLAQLANARNNLIRAQLSRDLAFANLANSMGLGGTMVDIDPTGIAEKSEPAQIQRGIPIFDQVPILQAAQTVLSAAVAQKKILDKEYYPVFHFLAGFNMRGSGLSPTVAGQRQSANVSGVLPTIPNYQVALIINWNFLDIIRLHQEKKVQAERIYQQQQDYNLVMQNLRTEDVQARARVQAALALAANMPVQVEASVVATRQAEARYKTGLGSVAQVAQANETLAQSRVQEAIAKVGVWRALLFVASVHGDIKPFLQEADNVQQGK